VTPSGPIQVADTDLSTVNTEVDWVDRIFGLRPSCLAG
jgi:hypothetical protein